jgi:hypothetical protein
VAQRFAVTPRIARKMQTAEAGTRVAKRPGMKPYLGSGASSRGVGGSHGGGGSSGWRLCKVALACLGLAQACSSESQFERRDVQMDSATADVESPIEDTGVSDQRSPETGSTDSKRPDTAAPDTGPADARQDHAIADAPGARDARNDRTSADSATPDSGTPDATIMPNDCALVSCGSPGDRSCCSDVYTFAVDAMGKSHPSLVTGFTAGTSALTATFRFEEPGQNGAIGMAFRTPRVPSLIRLTATWTGSVGRPFLTLEAPGAGCAYPFKTNWEADLQTQLYCWGGSFTPDAISFRIQATAAGDASLRITRIELR